jgi:hypothetical protein
MRDSVASSPRGAAAIETADRRQRAVIEYVQPTVDGGRFAVKRVIGESVVVEADIRSTSRLKAGASCTESSSGARAARTWQQGVS